MDIDKLIHTDNSKFIEVYNLSVKMSISTQI